MTSYELGVDDAWAYIAQGGDSITTRDMDAWFEAEFFNCARPKWRQFSDRMLERSHQEPDGQSNYLAGVLGVFCLFSDTGLPTGTIEHNYDFISNVSVYFELESTGKVSIDEAKRFVKYNIQSLYSALVARNTEREQRFRDLQRDYSIKLSEVKTREQVNARLRGEIRELEQQCLRLYPLSMNANRSDNLYTMILQNIQRCMVNEMRVHQVVATNVSLANDFRRYWDNVLLSMPEEPTRQIMISRNYIAKKFNREGAAFQTLDVMNESGHSPISALYIEHVWSLPRTTLQTVYLQQMLFDYDSDWMRNLA